MTPLRDNARGTRICPNGDAIMRGSCMWLEFGAGVVLKPNILRTRPRGARESKSASFFAVIKGDLQVSGTAEAKIYFREYGL